MRFLAAKGIPLGEMAELRVGAHLQIWDLEKVGENVVAVETQQRVDIEKDRRDRGHEDHVVSQRVHHAVACRSPDEHGRRGHEQLRDHPARADQRPVPPASKAPGRSGIDVRHRREENDHYTHDVNFPAKPPAHRGVTELMDDLDQHEAEVKEREISRRKHRLRLVRELRRVIDRDFHRETHDGQPHERAERADHALEQRLQFSQQLIRIEEREARAHEIHQGAAHLAGPAFRVTLEQLCAVRREIRVEQVRAVELGEKFQHVLLSGRALGIGLETILPHFLHCPIRPQPRNERIRFRAQAKELVVEWIVEHVKALAAKNLPLDADMRTQRDPLAGKAVPGFAEGLCVGRH